MSYAIEYLYFDTVRTQPINTNCHPPLLSNKPIIFTILIYIYLIYLIYLYLYFIFCILLLLES